MRDDDFNYHLKIRLYVKFLCLLLLVCCNIVKLEGREKNFGVIQATETL